MGASISTLHGMEKAKGREYIKSWVAVIGDSTFMHTGINSLMNMVYNQATGTVIILDNSTTGMTGHQDHAATGKTLKGQVVPAINIYGLCKSLGIEHVCEVDAFDQAELERVFDAQYELTLTEEVEIRYRTETSTDPVTGETTTEEVPYEYYILNVKLTSKPISSVASELLTPEQLEMYQVYRQTLGNKPLIFGGGSSDTSDSESLAGVEFVNGTRPGNQAVVDIAKSQVGNVGGQPYWSWYGFNSRVEWCACFVSWCYGQMGLSEPRFAACQSQGIPWFQSHGQWGGRDYANIAPGDAIFFDWDLDGSADHVGLVVGTDGSRVYTVEGNSGDACKIKSYSLTYECIKGYGLMNW